MHLNLEELEQVALEQEMEELEHQNVCRTYEIFQDASCFYLVNEPYFGGDCCKLHAKAAAKGVRMTEGWCLPICMRWRSTGYPHT